MSWQIISIKRFSWIVIGNLRKEELGKCNKKV